MSSNQSQENKNTQNFIQVIDKHIIGGSKKGRKKVGTEVFKKYENNTVINQIDENICKQMTLKQLRRTALYKKLHYDPQNRPASAGKQGARFGNKSYLNKAELCKYLSNPSKYIEDLNKKYKTSKRAGPRVRKTRAGDCIPKKRVPVNRRCNKNGDFKFIGETSSSMKCCYKKKQSVSGTNKSLNRKNKIKAGQAQLKKTINKKISNTAKTIEIINYLEKSTGISTQNDLKRYISSGKKFLTKLDKYDAKNPNVLKGITYQFLRNTIESLL